jgi:uncharacterized protein YcfL
MKKLFVLALILMSVLFFVACGGKSSQEIFTENLKSILLDMSSSTQNISSLQTDKLFNPSADVDTTKSSSMITSIELSNSSSSSEKLNFTSEILMDVAASNASQVVSVGMNGEKTQSGGIYFIDNIMMIKSGNSDKKMVRYQMDEPIANSFATLLPIERLNKLLDSDLQVSTDEQYTADIDTYISTILENTADDNYTVNTETKSILSKDTELSSITLNLKGQSAKQTLLDLCSLLNSNSNINSVFESTENDQASNENAIDKAIQSINDLTDSEIDNLSLAFKIQSIEDTAYGFEIIINDGNKTLTFVNNQYINGFEEQQAIKLINFDGSGFDITYNNILQEEDNYEGNFNYQLMDKSGKKDSITAQWSSVNTEDTYSSQYEYNTKIYNYSDGDTDIYSVSGTMNWQQTKDNSANITGSGDGDVSLNIGGETQKLLLHISLTQKYEDVEVVAPDFISKAGITVDSSDGLFSALDIDKEEYINQNDILKTIAGIILLLY